ncbi:MAG: GDSL-type esterase/lipase family protein, partial [Myxococcota bacterium]|nr:GDSL-type esterase/lipase family protein [Myxococcota bacterium]
MKKYAWLIILSFIVGAGLGEGYWKGELRLLADTAPGGWNREPNTIPYKLAALQGELALNEGEWALDFYRGIFPAKRTNELSLDARLSHEGQLETWLSSPAKQHHKCNRPNPRCGSMIGVGLLIEDIGTPSSSVLLQRYVNGRIKRQVLKCELPPPSKEVNQISLNYAKGLLTVGLNGESCSVETKLGVLPPLIRPGIREVHITNLKYGSRDTPLPLPKPRFLMWLLGGILITGLSMLETKTKASLKTIMTTTAFLGLSWFLCFADLKAWVESMRASWIPWRWLPLLLPCSLALFVKATYYSSRVLRARYSVPFIWGFIPIFLGILILQMAPAIGGSWEKVLASVIVAVIPLLLVWFMHRLSIRTNGLFLLLGLWSMVSVGAYIMTDPLHIWSVMWCSIGACMWAILIWANTWVGQVRAYNWVCLLASTILFIASEGMLRGSVAGRQWSNQGAKTEVNDVFGWISTANEGFSLMEKGEHTKYPDKGYPVSFSNIKDRKRIVAFGGSTTGGAFQNDDIKQFYPAKLEQNLGKQWQVINQGVGGWTTWHIREYIQKKAADLSPDIATFYIGHNDLLTFTPLPYEQLYNAWKRNPNAKSLSHFLGDFRLYHALRHTLISLRPAQRRAAVPLDHAQKNLETILELLPKSTSVILMSEGLSPDPGP